MWVRPLPITPSGKLVVLNGNIDHAPSSIISHTILQHQCWIICSIAQAQCGPALKQKSGLNRCALRPCLLPINSQSIKSTLHDVHPEIEVKKTSQMHEN